MLSPESTKRITALAAFAVPLMLVKAAAIVLGGPAASSGATTAPQAANPMAVAPPTGVATQISWTPKELAAATHVQALANLPFGPVPFLYDNQAQAIDTKPPVIENIDVGPVRPVKPDFTLGAIISGSRGKTAWIDGRPYREGDRIRNSNWIVWAIDSSARTVTLSSSETDGQFTLKVDPTG
jgi:hypothetical protein